MPAADDPKNQKAALAKLKKEVEKICKANDVAEKKAQKLLKQIQSQR